MISKTINCERCKGIFFSELLYILILIIISFSLCWHLPFSSLSGDVGDYAYGVYASMAHSLANGQYPFWNPNLMMGIPNTAITSSQLFYPITILLCRLLYNREAGYLSPQILNVLMSIHLSIFACSLYYLLRKLNVRKTFSFFISVLISSSSMIYFVIHWTALFSGYCYLPLMWAMSIQLMENAHSHKRWKYCALNGLTMGVIGLACASHSLLFALLQYGALYIAYLWKYIKDAKRLKNLTISVFFSGIIAGLMTLPVLLPFVDFLNKSYRFVADGSVQGMTSMSYYAFTESAVDNTAFIGLLGSNTGRIGWSVCLALFVYISFFIKNNVKPTAFFAAQFIFVFSLCYSIAFAYTEIFYYLPFYNQIREPFLYIPLAAISGGILAGIALEHVFESKSIKLSYTNLFVLFFGIGTIILINLLPKNNTLFSFTTILLIILSCITWKFTKNTLKNIVFNGFLYTICIISLAQVVFSLGRYRLPGNTEKITLVADSAKSIWEEDIPTPENLYRISCWSTTDCYPRNIAAVLGYYDAFGYINPIYASVMNMHINWSLDKKSFLHNIRYLISSEEDSDEFISMIYNAGFNEQKRINISHKNYDLEASKALIFFQNTNYGESTGAWMVYEYEEYDDETSIDDLNAIINSNEFLPQKKALVKGELNYQKDYIADSIYDLKITEYNTNSVKISVNSQSAGLLITSDIYDNGWNVYVDGKKQTVLEVNTAFRGVELQPGQHEVVFKFQPQIVYIGLICALGGIIFAVSLVVYSHKHTKNSNY